MGSRFGRGEKQGAFWQMRAVALLFMASMALALPHKPPGGSGIDGQYHPIYDHGHGPGGGEPTLHHVRALARARAARAHARAHAHAFEPFPDYGPYHPGFFKREAVFLDTTSGS